MDDLDQSAAIAFLSDPANHAGQPVSRIDTHISAVFLAADMAFKMKKAVRLPFLDFTDRNLRKTLCYRELDLNQAASGLYQDVIALTRDDQGGLRWGGTGPAVEWVLRMRRFGDKDGLPALLDAGWVDRSRIQDLIETIWASHRSAAPAPDQGGWAGLDWTIRTNRQSQSAYPRCLPADRVDHLDALSRKTLDRMAPLLEQRRLMGRVRRCHGDLHLANICRFQGRLVPFDALEFSDTIASVDLLYDLAFLLMDLCVHGHANLASHALNHYLDWSGDYHGLPALPLFLSLRAGVRAHVLAAAGDPAGARLYLDWARQALAPRPVRIVAVGGLSGSGKSRMAREAAPYLGLPGAIVIRSDALRKQLAGRSPTDRLGPEGYGPEMGQRTYARLFELVRELAAQGVPVIADAVFAAPHERRQIAAIAQDLNLPFDGLWLSSDPDLARQRIQARVNNVSDATAQVLDRQLCYDIGTITWTPICSNGSKQETLALGLAALSL